MSTIPALAPFAAGGWRVEGGYYLHKGRGYLQGVLYNPRTTAPLSTTCLTRLPKLIRPASVVAVTLIQAFGVGADPATPGIVEPEELGAHIFPNGTMVLDSIPPFADSVPGKGWEAFAPDLQEPLQYEWLLGNVSWPVGAAVADTPPIWLPLSAFVGPDFTDVDAEYAIHDSRLHLRGHVTANFDNARQMTQGGYPDGATPALAEGSFDFTDLHVAGKRRSAILGTFGIFIDGQTLKGDLLASRPRFQGSSPDALAMPENGPGYEGWEVGEPVAGFGLRAYPDLSCFHPEKPFGKGHGGTVFWPSVGPPIADEIDIDINAALSNWVPTPEWFKVSLVLEFRARAGVSACPLAGEYAKPDIFTFELVGGEDLAADWMPWGLAYTPPDAGVYAWVGRYPGEPGPADWGAGDYIGTWDGEHGEGFGRQFTPAFKETFFHRVEGPILRGGGGLEGQEHGEIGEQDPNTLWRPGELNSAGRFIFSGFVNEQEFRWTLTLTPYWLKRKDYLKAGDSVDLTGSGYPLGGGSIEIGPGARGIAPLGRGRPESALR